MPLLVLLVLTEFLAPEVLRQHFYGKSKAKFYVTAIIHVILSIFLWLLYFKIVTYNSFFDNPSHIWRLMTLNGTIALVVLPRIVLILFHFTGKLIRIRTGGHIRWLTNTGLAFMVAIFSVTAISSLYGRFNFTTEEVEAGIEGLHPDLDGLRIVQISDLHLASFNHHREKIEEVMETVKGLKPDLLVNTGDFVTFGWREFDGFDTILARISGKYGSYAVFGNHDFGGYHPDYSEAEERNNVLIMKNLIRSSGYRLLYESAETLQIGNASVGLIGLITQGSYPDIRHGDLAKAMEGTDSADIRILLSHDPNQWEEDVAGKTRIELTLSGHTHGMQVGIMTRKFRWSPAKYIYPHWNGLYSRDGQYHYVNRGLGVLGIPFRVWMPPEITVITLTRR